MNPPEIRYPFDGTGINPNNLVEQEPQALAAGRTIRVTGPNYGPFYQQGLIVTDAGTMLPLTADQYYVGQLQTMPTKQTGLGVFTVIMITDPTVSNNVLLTYQVVGGEYSASAQAIIDQINALNLDDRPASWPAIIGKPDGFPPSAHLHDAGDIYGFEYVTEAINRIAAAILLGDEASHDAIYKYIDTSIGSLAATTAALQAALNAHLADFGNPHRVTATQTGAYTTAQSDANLNAAITTINGTITSNVTNLQNQINGKQAVGNYAVLGTNVAFGQINSGVIFSSDVHGGTGFFAGDVWAFVSDPRLKENIRPIDDVMNRIHSLKGVFYNHNELGASLIPNVNREDEYVGFLTTDMEKALPMTVGPAPFDIDPETGASISGMDFKTGKYERVVPLTVEAIKHLDERLERHERKVKELIRTLVQTAKQDTFEAEVF